MRGKNICLNIFSFSTREKFSFVMNKNRHALNKNKKKRKISRKSFYPWIIRSSTGRQRYLAVKKEAAESRVRGRVSWIRMNLGQRFNFHRGPSPHDIFLQFLFAIRRHVQSNYSRKISNFHPILRARKYRVEGRGESWKEIGVIPLELGQRFRLRKLRDYNATSFVRETFGWANT